MRAPFEFRTDAKWDVAGFGTNAVDHVVRVAAYPKFNTKIRLTAYETLPGGEAASTLTGLQRLRLRTTYAGRFGDDAAGAMGLASLRLEGVDIANCDVVPAARTQVAFIIIDEQSGERTVMWDRDAKLGYQPEEAPLAIAVSAKILHMTPHDTAAVTLMAQAATAAGTIVSLDIDRRFDGVEELLGLTDVMIASSEFLEEITGMRDKLSALTEVAARFGCAVAGVTRGAEGSYLLVDGVFIETPGFAVPGGCIDTTGAGDAFRTGLLYGLLQGMEMEDAARCANAVAALKCRASGARNALPTPEEVQTMLKNF